MKKQGKIVLLLIAVITAIILCGLLLFTGKTKSGRLDINETSDGNIIEYGIPGDEYTVIDELPWPEFWGGASYGIITPDEDLYLVDGGFLQEDMPRVKEYIDSHGGRVKGWFLTHPHVDHIGAFLDYVKENGQNVEKVYYAPFTKEFFEKEEDPEVYKIINNAILFYEWEEWKADRPEDIAVIPFEKGDTVTDGDMTITCISSFRPQLKDVNGNSLVFDLSIGDFSMVFTGDMTEETLKYIQKDFGDGEFDADIMQIPHHGYMAGIARDDIYRYFKPELALLDCTRQEYDNNSVNIQQHVKMIEDLGIKVLPRFYGGNKIYVYSAG